MSTIAINTTETIHRAAQYLTAAAISCLEKKPDDSHTNMGWNSSRKTFTTRHLNDNELYLSLSLINFRLEFLKQDTVLASKPLSGVSHKEILNWLSEVFKDLKLNSPFTYNFHYDLPYSEMTDDYVFDKIDDAELSKEADLRDQAYKALKEIAQNIDEDAEVRIWPHHFDTGTLISLGNNSSIGLGLAIPDSMMDEYYYYVSGWKGSEMMPVSGLPELKNGRWEDGQWKGAILEANNSSLNDAKEFLNSAVEFLSN